MLHAVLTLALALPPAGGEGVSFGRDVRPILSQHCFACHGPDPDTREAKLRLDRWDDGLVRREVLVPGSLERSEVYYRLISNADDERMPPPETKKELSAEEVDVLRRWIEAGAGYERHWSFTPIEPTEPPVVADELAARNEIDRFVLARLERAGLSLSEPADRRTLIRRVSLDLTGMPPTPAEVRAFLEDPRADAYERVVDRLLGSKPYAERMALAWMDAARYGDTSVFHADGPRDMWPWRDWVIDAYYRNMPFDRFTIEQLAGDLIPDATLEQRIASGFYRNHGTSDEGGAIDEELRVSYMIDRVKTTGNVWLGLSVECAQCHAHKFDPIEQRDYYRLFAIFDQSPERGFQTRNGNAPPLVRVPSMQQEREERRLAREAAKVEAWLAQVEPPASEHESWMAEQRVALSGYQPPELGTWRTLGPFTKSSQREAFETAFGPEESLGLDQREWKERTDWPDGAVHPLGLPNNSAQYMHRTIRVPQDVQVTASLGSDDTIQVWLNGASVLAKNVGRGAAADQDQVVLDLRAGENDFLLKVCNGGGPSGFYFRLVGPPLPEPVVAALRLEDSALGEEERATIRAHYVRQVWPDGVERVAELERLRAEQTALDAAIPTVMVMADRAEPRQTYVLDRGQYDAPREDQPVEPGVLEFLLQLPAGAPANRMGLAQWLVHPEHPLTARVAVNRYWALLFGRGLVETVMDFGAQGATPTHPELLDWLARDFVESGWDVQRALKQMVMSATYRQASRTEPALRAADPENGLLSRAPRFRLQGELLRDQALAVSGLLVDRVGGPGVKPYQPEGLWNEVSLNKNVRFVQDHGEKLYRKSMYIYWKRSSPHPAMTTFDAPTREKCVVQRQRTNTPLQALVTLNDVQFVEAARNLAERMLTAAPRFEERLDHGLELCTARPADELRRRALGRVLYEQLAVYRADPEAAAALLAVGESPRDESLDPAEHAAWTVVASMLLNLDETLCRE